MLYVDINFYLKPDFSSFIVKGIPKVGRYSNKTIESSSLRNFFSLKFSQFKGSIIWPLMSRISIATQTNMPFYGRTQKELSRLKLRMQGASLEGIDDTGPTIHRVHSHSLRKQICLHRW